MGTRLTLPAGASAKATAGGRPNEPSGSRHMPLHLLSRVAVIRRGRSDAGQDLLEYALLVSLIVITALGAVEVLGNIIKTSFWEIIAETEL